MVVPAAGRVQELYAAADLFATPSRVEGMPFSMLEALASGLPVAASDISGQAAVGRGLGACRLTPLDPGAFGEAIGALLDREPGTAHRDAAEAIDRVRARYGLDGWVERLLAVYDELLPTSST
jgi:glycosyltransferase involved in cell wall biosynthesis